MPEFRKSVLIGYSGHGYVVAEAALEAKMNVFGYVDRDNSKSNPFALTYLGAESDPAFVGWENDFEYLLGIGNNNIRMQVYNLFTSKNQIVKTIIHPLAYISKYSEIGAGTFVACNAIVNSVAKIGAYCILNTGCIVEHECLLSNGVHVAPGAVLAGNVKVGENSFIGANSIIKQGVTIGKNVTIGAGSVVLKNVPNNEVWLGNPAKKIK